MAEGYVGTVGIIGAGAKGREIAVYALLGGCRVILEDMSVSRLADATAYISAGLRAAVTRGEIDMLQSQRIEANWSATQSLDDVSRKSDLLIEAAPEDAELQLEIFTIFDKFAKPQAILASAARSVSVADLAGMTNCPERCVGLHFPATEDDTKFLEIVRTPSTSERTLRICANFAHNVGLEARIKTESEAPDGTVKKAQTP